MKSDEIAARIVADIMVNGIGQKADRLVLVTDHGINLGGWGKLPLADRIAGILAKELDEKE